ncbi:MAG: hypothetical protein DI535_16535 [Citrobacter freundii]|nr:MAG: hypothetical protein DI535_16535 [Citrobacter freundii]
MSITTRLLLSLFFLFGSATFCASQSTGIDTLRLSKTVAIQLQRLANAMMKGDYETLAKTTYPSLLAKAGGPAKAVAKIKAEMEEMLTEGISFDSVYTGTPVSFVTAGPEIHTLIPQTILLTVKGRKLKSDSFMIGITSDKGNTWYFIDVSSNDEESIRQILPHYNPALKIPARQPPTRIQ